MAISPELQKLLDGAKINMPTPTPYAQQPVQFLQPQVQQPVFQPIQIDTTLPTPYVSNVPTFEPIQPLINPIETQQFQPINFDGLMNSIGANQGIVSPVVQQSPVLLDNASFSPQENIINKGFQDAGYPSVQKAKSDIEAVAEAEQGRGFFGTIDSINQSINESLGIKPSQESYNTIKNTLNTFGINTPSQRKENEMKNAGEKAKKINENFGYNIVGDIQKQTASDASIAQTTWNDGYKGVEKTLGGEGILNFNRNITKGGSNFSNVITPLISQKNNRSFELRLQGREEEAKQIEDVIDYNIIQARNNLQEQIQRISNIQNKDNTISDTKAADMAAAEISKEYGSVNAFLKRGLKRLDGTTIDDETKRLDFNTREDFLNNQGNTLDLETLNESSGNPLRILGGNIQKYIYNPLFQLTSRLIGEGMQAVGMSNAAADAGYISDLGISERKQSMGDKVSAFSQEILDVVPELTTAVGTTLLTLPLQQINILKGVGFQSIGGLTKLNQSKAITNTISQLGKTVLAESIQNGVFDAFGQNINGDVNYYANLGGGVLGSIPELYGLSKQWNKFYKIDDVKGMIKNNYIAEKMMGRLEEGKTLEEAEELRKGLTDDVIRKDYGEVDVNKVDQLTDGIDKAIEMERNIKQNASKRLLEIDKEISQTTDSATLEALNSERKILSRTSKEYDEIVNFQIGQQSAIRNLLTKDNITAEDADYFARIIKTVLPNTRNEPLLREQILNLARGQRDIQIQDTLFKSFGDSSLKSSDQGYLVSQVSKSTGLDVAKSYNLSDIDEVINSAKKSSQFKWLGDTDVNGDLVYFNKIDGQKLVLNNEGLAKLNLTEQAPIIKIEREMGSLKEGTESAGYIKIANENQEVFGFTDEELASIIEGDLYNGLLEQIDNFIPCIR